MKKVLLFISFLIGGIALIQAQTLVSTNVEKKNAILEEFTGIHCQFCPDGHEIGQALFDANPYNVVLINIHTGGFAVPGTGEPDYRTTFGDGIAGQATISGYPAGTINRHYFSDLNQAGGTAMSRGSWDAAAGRMFNEDSPVNVGAETSYNEATRELTINVELYYTSDAPTSSNYLNVALVQNHIIGPQQVGSTWVTDYEHNHMLRNMITGQWGEEITTTTIGTFVQRTYVYTVPDNFTDIPCIVADCDVAVFIAEDQQEIYSGVQIPAIDGTTYLIGSFTNLSDIFDSGSTGNTSTFNFDFTNGFSSDEPFTFTLSKENEPAGWSSSFTINGNTYADSGTETITGDGTETMSIDIVPDGDAGYVKYVLTVESDNYPEFWPKKIEVYLIANIGTLLIHNSGSWADGSPVDFEDVYFEGFDYASVDDYASCSYKMFVLAAENDALGNIHNLFYNVAWTFPGINEEIVGELSTFLDNGGNLFIAGQDLGWDTWDAAGSGTLITQAFYTDYLNANYQADGSTSNNSIYPNPDDGVFGHLSSSPLENIYGGSNMYPDEMTALGNGSVILDYLDNPSKGAAVKSTDGNYKVVYLGFDPPMITDVSVRNEIFKRSIYWFNGMPVVSFDPKEGSIDIPLSSVVTIYFDQGIRNLDDTEITDEDIVNLVTFESVTKDPVAFTGVINPEKTEIIITPDNNLNGSTSYTVSISNYENDNDVTGAVESTTFLTEADIIGVENHTNAVLNLYPNPVNNQLFIMTNFTDYSFMKIIDINGSLVFERAVNNEENEVSIDLTNFSEGMYFIHLVSDNEVLIKKFIKMK